MKGRRISWFMVLVVLAVSAAVLFYRSQNQAREVQLEQPQYKEVPVEYGTFQIMVTANGVVKPIDRIELKSKASGEIVELPVEEGDFVRKGDLIAKLDQKDERTAVAQGQADLDIAKAELKQATRNFERRKALFKQKLVSREELDQSELRLAVAKGQLVQATTTLDRARERLAESIIQAPLDGIILKKNVEEGQIIASGVTNVSGGTPIADIADMRSVYIEAGIDEVDIGKIKVGQSALVVAEAFPHLKFSGTIVRIAPEAKIEQNVTLFNVIVEVENKEGKLQSGMNGEIRITVVSRDRVLLMPTVAAQPVSDRDAGPHVRSVLLKQNGRFVPTRVEIGQSNFKQTEIIAGVSEGATLGIPMTSRLKEENERLEKRIKSSRSFGTPKKQPGTP
ncbi:MAG: efflux RND transporter periplasmic adaptor subunit [bacterium]|nr:efflux RND transporter periplasmic adaptor subunit [bacterium]